MLMRWRNVLSALVVVLLLSCRTYTDTLSISQLDSYHHGALLNIFDTLAITYYPAILNNRVNGGFAANNNPDYYRHVSGGTATIMATRHTILSDSAQTSRSMERKGTKKTTKAPMFTTPQLPTLIAYTFLLLISVLTVVILRFLIKRL